MYTELFQKLNNLVENHFNSMEKSDALKHAQEFCNSFMIQANNNIQSNLSNWSEDKLRGYANVVRAYAEVNSGILTLRKGENDSKLILQAKIKFSQLFEEIKDQSEFEYTSSQGTRQKQMADEIYLPHLAIMWVLDNC